MTEIRIVEGRPAVLRETVASRPSALGDLLRQFRAHTRGHAQGNRHRRATGSMSQMELARLANVDSSYVSLLERGLRPVVTREVVLSFADALELSAAETDCLLFAAGLAPQRDYQSLYERAETRLSVMRAALNGGMEIVGREEAAS